ncbi:MAG TPA: DSD1 family PLP-dependent enzyme [Casimicrobiaceae bacterium]|nr:DSD1 family PLP-dependent enzyme [Casimicrobiaceae bacterium]
MINLLDAVPTPAAVVDETRMLRNIARMQKRLDGHGVELRPHVKTSKSVEVVKRQQDAGAAAITVSTLKEAEQFFAAGFDDILYAVCMAPGKLDRALGLVERGCRLQIITDSLQGAQAIVAGSRAARRPLTVLIEVDSDGERSGIPPDDELLLEVGRVLHDGGCSLQGVMTHAGSSYECSTPAALLRVADQERDLCVLAAQRLRDAGLPCPVVSIGSTPTALSASGFAGVSEVRAGVYVFFDLVMAGIGVCTLDDIALSVLTTVIGHQRDKGWIICDAGWMALSRDRGTQSQATDQGYGIVCDASGSPMAGYVVSGANQEHGIIVNRETPHLPELEQRFPVGSKLRVLPNHACATAAQYTEYCALARDGGLQTWPRFSGW